MKGIFTADTFETICTCGEKIHMLRRGPVALIPSGHHCHAKDNQDSVLRTIRAEESCGLQVTPKETARRLREWEIGAELKAGC